MTDVARAAWGAITESEAKRLAENVVQRLADSEPEANAIEAMERLKGTPQESMFVVDAETLIRMVTIAISDAAFDAPHYGYTAPSEKGIIEVPTSMYESERAKLVAAGWMVVHSPSVKRSHVIVAYAAAAPPEGGSNG